MAKETGLDPRYAKTRFVVEATDFEMQCLWRTHHWEKSTHQVEWENDSFGLGVTVGQLNSNPVCISVKWATVNGMLVLFYHAMSITVDHNMIRQWLDDNCNPQQGGRRAHCDAQNFHHALNMATKLKEAS